MKLFNSVADIEKATTTIVKQGESLKQSIHKAGLSVLSLWVNKVIDNQEAARLVTLVQVASPYHQRSFADWVQAKTDLLWSNDTKVWYAGKDVAITPAQFKSAALEPFWEVSPPKEAAPFDIKAALAKVIKQAEAHQKKPVQGDVIDMEIVRQLRELAK